MAGFLFNRIKIGFFWVFFYIIGMALINSCRYFAAH